MSSRAHLALVAVAVSALAAICALPAAGAASGQASASPRSDHGIVRLIDCRHGKRAKDRFGVFRGEMFQLQQGAVMEMRFGLQEKAGRGAWTDLDAPGLGVWQQARPEALRFVYKQRIVGFEKGVAYRVGVTFRWLDANGEEIARENVVSRACRQPGKLPNLKVRDSVKVSPGPTPGTAVYAIRVANTGFAVARGVELRLHVDGSEVDTRRIGRLKRGQRRTVRFVGPACTTQVTATIDPTGRIREVTEQDNSVAVACPSVQ